MTKVKICGIRRTEDVEMLNRLRPEYAGFVFAESRRRVTKDAAAQLGGLLLPEIRRVGVFVDENPSLVLRVMHQACLDVVQLHGHEDARYIEEIRSELPKNVEIWRGFGVRDDEQIKEIQQVIDAGQISGLLMDTYKPGVAGGTGEVFDWSVAQRVICQPAFKSRKMKFILAGGLNPDNAAMAVKTVSPHIVDVSSGVEANGFKDEMKIKTFIEMIRQTGGM